MKSATTRLSTFILFCFILFAATAYRPAATEVKAEDSYNGYWVAKSGEEFIVMNHAKIPDQAIEKNAKGEVTSINNQAVRSTLRYNNQSRVNGKQIDTHFFILTLEDMESNINSTPPKPKKSYPRTFSCDLTSPNWKYCMAYYTCYNPSSTIAYGWQTKSPCTTSTYCTAYHLSSGTAYYITCNSNN